MQRVLDEIDLLKCENETKWRNTSNECTTTITPKSGHVKRERKRNSNYMASGKWAEQQCHQLWHHCRCWRKNTLILSIYRIRMIYMLKSKIWEPGNGYKDFTRTHKSHEKWYSNQKKKLAPERYRTQISIEKITSQMKVITICVDSTAGNAEIASVGVWMSAVWMNIFFPTRISKSHHRHSALGIVSGNKHSLYTLIFSQKYLKITIHTEKMCEKRSVCEWRCVGTLWLHTATWRNAYLIHDYSMNDYTCFIFRYHIISTSARFHTVIVRDVLSSLRKRRSL